MELTFDANGRLIEQAPPASLASGSVTALDVYGSLFYAGARTLQVRLPDPAGARSAVVVLRLRGRSMLGATALSVLADYADRLAAGGGRLYLSGVDPALSRQVDAGGRFDLRGPTRVYEAEPAIGSSTARAVTDAEAWLVTRQSPRANDAPGDVP